MKSSLLPAILVCFILNTGFSQEHGVSTIILLRHAEKADDGTKDPPLNTAGIERSQKIAAMLKDTQVDAIFSTNYKRTRETAQPIAEMKNLTIQSYEPRNSESMAQILESHKGKTVVMIGHSNTVPWTANYLVGKETYQNLDDNDYNDMLIVSLWDRGNAKVVWLAVD